MPIEDFEIPELSEKDILSVGPIPTGVITEEPQMMGIPDLRPDEILAEGPPPVQKPKKKAVPHYKVGQTVKRRDGQYKVVSIDRKKGVANLEKIVLPPDPNAPKQEFYRQPAKDTGSFRFESAPFQITDKQREDLIRRGPYQELMKTTMTPRKQETIYEPLPVAGEFTEDQLKEYYKAREISNLAAREIELQKQHPTIYSITNKGVYGIENQISAMSSALYSLMGMDDLANESRENLYRRARVMNMTDEATQPTGFMERYINPHILPTAAMFAGLRGVRAPMPITMGTISGLQEYGVNRDPLRATRAGVTGFVTGAAMRGAQSLPTLPMRVAGGAVAGGGVPAVSRAMQGQEQSLEASIPETALGGLVGFGPRRPLPVPRLGQYTNPYPDEPLLLTEGTPRPGTPPPPPTPPRGPLATARMGQGRPGQAPLEGPILPWPPPNTSVTIRGPEGGLGRPDRLGEGSFAGVPEELMPTPEEETARIQGREKLTKAGKSRMYYSRPEGEETPGLAELLPTRKEVDMTDTDPVTGLPMRTPPDTRTDTQLSERVKHLESLKAGNTDPVRAEKIDDEINHITDIQTQRAMNNGFQQLDLQVQEGQLDRSQAEYLKKYFIDMYVEATDLLAQSIEAEQRGDLESFVRISQKGLDMTSSLAAMQNHIDSMPGQGPTDFEIHAPEDLTKPASIKVPRKFFTHILKQDEFSTGVTTFPDTIDGMIQTLESAPAAATNPLVQNALTSFKEYRNEMARRNQNTPVFTNPFFPRSTTLSRTIPHESVHVGQWDMVKAIEEKVKQGLVNLPVPENISDLADPQWLANHPVIGALMTTPKVVSMTQNNPRFNPISLLGAEIPAYIYGGSALELFENKIDAINALFDLFDHLMDRWGPDILDVLEQRIDIYHEETRPYIPLAKNLYALRQYEQTETTAESMAGVPRIEESGLDTTGDTGPDEATDRYPEVPNLDAEASDLTTETVDLGDIEGFHARASNQPKRFSVKGYSGKVNLIGPGQYPGTVKVRFVDTGLVEEFELKELRGERGGRTVKDPIIDMIKKNPPPAFDTPTARAKPPVSAAGVPIYKSGQLAKLMPGGIRVLLKRPAPNTHGMTIVEGPTGEELTVRNVDLAEWNAPLQTEEGWQGTPPNSPTGGNLGTDDEPLGELTTPVIKSQHNMTLAAKFIQLLQDADFDYDPAVPPGIQVYQKVLQGDIRDDIIDSILKESNVTWEEFANEVLYTYSEAGRTLQTLSWIDREAWRRLERENPDLLNKIMPPHIRVKLILNELERTEIGRNLWKRMGGVAQKAVLTQMATFAVNTGTTLNKIPLDMATSAIGVVAKNWKEGTGTFKEGMEQAGEDIKEVWKAYIEIYKSLNPKQIKELWNNFKRSGDIGESAIYAKHKAVTTLLEKYHPEIHSKLFARPLQDPVAKMGDIGKQLDLAEKQLLPRIKDKEKRREYQNELRKMRRRYEREDSWKMQPITGPEYAYDQLLRPLQFAEFLFRRPMFVMWLNLELMNKGISLKKVIENTNKYEHLKLTPDQWKALPENDRMTFRKIPEDVIKSALNKALELTYAYDPEDNKSAPVMERAASHIIDAIGWMGPLLPLGEMFPRAAYNGAMALYNYSPLPFIFMGSQNSPLHRAFFPKFDTDPKTQEKYRTNPASLADWERVGKAVGGTLILFTMFALRHMLKDEQAQWYELPIPFTKGDDGRRKYIDIRAWKPISEMYHLADIAERLSTGTYDSHKIGDELLEVYTGMKRQEGSPDTFDILNAVGDMWGGEDNNARIEAAKVGFGRDMSIYLTPLLNLRDFYAQFDEEQNKTRDLRGTGFMGPFVDKLPWFSKELPAATSPVYRGELPISDAPLLKLGGVKLQTQQNFMGREFARMGVNVRDYLGKDPDPQINRAQDKAFEILGNMVGQGLAQDPSYVSASDDVKMMRWEQFLIGETGIVAAAKAIARGANTPEEMRRVIKEQVPGPYTRRVFGIERILESLKSPR